MARQLRPRRSHISYAALAGHTEEEIDEGGPSNPRPIEEGSSGSEFGVEEEKHGSSVNNGSDFDELEDDADTGVDEEFVEDRSRNIRQRTKKALKVTSRKAKTTSSLTRSNTTRVNALPVPSVDHRRRAMPISSYAIWVERLTHPPMPFGFGPAQSMVTDKFHQDKRARDRSTRLWEYNVGSGPLWELVEDRAWYKEGSRDGKDEIRRPLVYEELLPQSELEQVDYKSAICYLPGAGVTEEVSPAAIPCSFGPIHNQTRIEVSMFDTLNISEYFEGSNSCVFNAGSSVWGIDWCPIQPGERYNRNYKHYLAVAPMPSRFHSPELGGKTARPVLACIQIWSLQPRDSNGASQDDVGTKFAEPKMACEMVLCLDGGPAFDIKWCPLPSHDVVTTSTRSRKLGLLAGTFEDGSMSIYVVPDPRDFESMDSILDPIYVKIQPIIRVELEDCACWSLDWANSEVIATGTTNGTIAVYNIKNAIESKGDSDATITSLLPTHYFSVHQCAIRDISWVRAPTGHPPDTTADPTIIASVAYDGMSCLVDIRNGGKAVMNRTRDVLSTVSYSPYMGGPVTTDQNQIKSYSVSPSMIGRGHTLLEPDGPVWSISTSDYHPHVASASCDGSCLVTNGLKAARKSGRMPQFVYKLYQIDYSRKTGEYRMLEHFLPQQTIDRASTGARSKSKPEKSRVTPSIGFGGWPVEVGVHRVAWHNGAGIESCGLLASATATGLCRIDWLTGRWHKGKMPFATARGGKVSDGDDIDADADAIDDATSDAADALEN